MAKTILALEKAKYQQMWDGPQYRRRSAGMRAVWTMVHYCSGNKADTLIDLGCGTGQCGKFFARKYFPNTYLLDFVPEAVDVEGLPFIEANMWELHALPKFDWIFCSDVMEHIPPEHVDATLDGMAHITRKGGLIKVCHLESDGEDFWTDVGKLHLSVYPAEWWKEKIEARWELRYSETDWKETTFILGAPL